MRLLTLLWLAMLVFAVTGVKEAQAVPTFQAAGTAVASTVSVSPVWPAHAVNDIALLFVESNGDEQATLSTAAGFDAVTNSPQVAGNRTRITVFWARATSTTMATPTVADPGNHVYAQIVTYRSVISTGNPWDVTGGGGKTAASTSVTVTGVTTTLADTLIVQAVARDTDKAAAAFSAQANANLTGITERSDAGTGLGKGGGFGVWDGVKATAGATGDTTATVTSSRNAFLTIALKPLLKPTVAKSFSPATIGTGGSSTLTVTLSNANATAIIGVAFTDTYPSNLVNAATPVLTNTCLGTATAAANGSSLALSGGRIPASGSCTLTVVVTSAVAGSYLNSTGAVTTTNAGTGTAATATLTVLNRPTVAKSFSPATIGTGGISTLTVTLTNANATAITGAAFTDTYPANVTNTGTPGLTNTCGGTATAAANGSSLALSAGTIPASDSCTLTVKVTSAVAGSYLNSTGSVTTTNAGSGAAATAILTVTAPTVAKGFSPATIALNGTSTLTITLTNATATAMTGAAFTDVYPADLLNTATPGAATTCTLGTVTAAANGSSLALSGGTIPANGSCTVTVAVTSAVQNSYLNSTGPVTTTSGGTGTAATAILAVNSPTVAKSFSPATIVTNGTSTLTVTLTNTTATAFTGAAFTDTYPSNLVNAATPGLTNSCGGTATAAASGTSLALSGGTIPANGSCTVTVAVTSAVAGSYLNNTGAVTTTNSGPGTAATATLTVLTPPTVAKSFSPATIGTGGSSTLTVTLSNANATAITGVAFTDTYPSTNLKNAGTPGLTNTCGGTATAAANGSSLALSGGTIPASGSCTLTVAVTSAVAGSYLNSTGPVTTTNAGTGTAATATLTVLTPSTVAKSFSPASIGTGGSSTLTVTLSNSNATAITGAAFTDAYPANLFNTATPGAATTCTGGTVTVTAAANDVLLALSGGTIPANGSCTVTVAVTSVVVGSYLNSTGPVTTTNAGSGAAATATLTVTAPTVAKSFSPATIAVDGTSTLTITLSNANATAMTGAAFTDTYPFNLVNAATPALTNSCGGTATAAASGTSLALSGGTIPANGSCTLTVKVTSAVQDSYLNSTGPVTTTNQGTGTAATAILAVNSPTVAKSFSPATIALNGTSTLTVTLSNATATAFTGAAFTDAYPLNLVNAATPGLTNSCGGTATAAASGTSLALSGGTIPANGSCKVTVAVTSAVAGSYLNNTGAVTTANSGPGTEATATLTVLGPPTVAKSFSPASITTSGSSTLTVTLSNANATAISGAAFTDTYPANVTNTGTPGLTNSCGGTATAAANDSSLALSAGTIPASGSCTVTVAVTSAVVGSYLNNTGSVTTTNAGTGTAATATLTVTSAVGSFNAFETSTTAGAITGVIKTKIAGSAFSLDVVAISGGAQVSTFTDTVKVELLGNTTTGISLDANNCPASSSLLQTVSPNPTITSGRSSVNFAAVSDAWKDVRVRISFPTTSPTVTSCSTNNFAIRPNAFVSVSVSDQDWQTAGTLRSLYNTTATGGNVHKAGQPFTLIAHAVNAASATTANYNGSPDASLTACLLPSGCTLGTLATGTWASSSGTVASTTATYSEAGAFTMKLVDTSFASVDASDSSTAERYIESVAFNVGRFVPNHFALSTSNTPQLKTFNDATCTSRSFTYMGQPFGYVTAPQALVTAQNAAGGTTSNYKGSLWKLAATDLTQTYGYTLTPVSPSGLDTGLIGAPTVTASNNGTGTATVGSGDRLAFTRSATTPLAPFTAAISLSMSVADGSENSVTGNGIIATATPALFNGGGSGISFDSGNEFRYGRIKLSNAYGSELLDLPVPMEAQHWNGTAFVVNTADNCTLIAASNIAMGNYQKNLAACETAISISGTLSGGKSNLKMLKPGAGNSGSVDLTVNLGSTASGNTCLTVGGAGPAATPANLTYLQGAWTGTTFDKNPSARATFGIYKSPLIYRRENY